VIDSRIVVFGYSDLGFECLKFLMDRGERVIKVFTHEDNEQEKVWFPSMKKLASERGIPVSTETDLTLEAEALQTLKPDLIFSFYYRNLIPTRILKMARKGAFNMHGSYLPKYRGRAPVNWAVLNGEKQTGATLHVMVEKADAGDIVDQQAVPIGPDDTTAIVQRRVTDAAVKLLVRQIEALKAGTAPRRRQDPAQATYFGRRRPEDGLIDWSWPAERIHNLVRAVTHPYPGAFTDKFGIKTYIWASRPAPRAAIPVGPGEIRIEKGRVFAGCGDGGLLEICRVQREGEEETDGAVWARRNPNADPLIKRGSL